MSPTIVYSPSEGMSLGLSLCVGLYLGHGQELEQEVIYIYMQCAVVSTMLIYVCMQTFLATLGD